MTAEFTLLQCCSKSQDAIGNETLRASIADSEAIFSIQQLSSALSATQSSLAATQSSLVQNQNTLVGTQSTMVQMQLSNAIMQSNNLNMMATLRSDNLNLRAVVGCLNRGMLADLNGTCYSAAPSSGSSGTIGNGSCTNETSTVPPPCKPGYASVSHQVTQSCSGSESSPVTFSCTGKGLFYFLILNPFSECN